MYHSHAKCQGRAAVGTRGLRPRGCDERGPRTRLERIDRSRKEEEGQSRVPLGHIGGGSPPGTENYGHTPRRIVRRHYVICTDTSERSATLGRWAHYDI